MSLRLIDTTTGEIIDERAPATDWHTRQLKHRAKRRTTRRVWAFHAVWQHVIVAGIAALLVIWLASSA